MKPLTALPWKSRQLTAEPIPFSFILSEVLTFLSIHIIFFHRLSWMPYGTFESRDPTP
ncbi:MAG: hypothetical protein JNL22_17520 [Bacteroidales bacterium]|nr:hypothetical protein [Bacteroidales bacterium]